MSIFKFLKPKRDGKQIRKDLNDKLNRLRSEEVKGLKEMIEQENYYDDFFDLLCCCKKNLNLVI